MRPLFISLALVLYLSGCTSVRLFSPGDIFNDYTFSSHSGGNPYSADKIGRANEFIEERIAFYKASDVLTAYLVPTPYSNRLVFIGTRHDKEPSDELCARLAKDVEGFLSAILATRPWNKKPNQSPEPMPLKRHGSS